MLLISGACGNKCTRKGKYTVCELQQDLAASHFDEGIPMDRNFSRPSNKLGKLQTQADREDLFTLERQGAKSKFTATVVGQSTAAQRLAVDFCLDRAAENWISDIAVTVLVNFSGLDGPLLLGTGQPSRNWMVNKFICPVALAEAVVGEDLNDGKSGDAKYDILMTLNTKANWYEGTDAQPGAGQYDLVTVCLHEVYHGLFMAGGNIGVSLNQTDLSYSALFLRDGAFGRFDAFMANQDGCMIGGYEDNTSNLGAVLTGNNLWFVSQTVEIGKLHAPRPYVSGSSLYHLSELEYGSGEGDNDLMTPAIGSKYAQHNVGGVTLAMQQAALNIEGLSGARVCNPIGIPKVDESEIPQGGGSGGDRGQGGNGGGSFTITLGSAEVSGWILIGAGAGMVAIVLVVMVVVMRVVGGKRRSREKEMEHDHEQDVIDLVKGSNGGGLV